MCKTFQQKIFAKIFYCCIVIASLHPLEGAEKQEAKQQESPQSGATQVSPVDLEKPAGFPMLLDGPSVTGEGGSSSLMVESDFLSQLEVSPQLVSDSGMLATGGETPTEPPSGKEGGEVVVPVSRFQVFSQGVKQYVADRLPVSISTVSMLAVSVSIPESLRGRMPTSLSFSLPTNLRERIPTFSNPLSRSSGVTGAPAISDQGVGKGQVPSSSGLSQDQSALPQTQSSSQLISNDSSGQGGLAKSGPSPAAALRAMSEKEPYNSAQLLSSSLTEEQQRLLREKTLPSGEEIELIKWLRDAETVFDMPIGVFFLSKSFWKSAPTKVQHFCKGVLKATANMLDPLLWVSSYFVPQVAVSAMTMGAHIVDDGDVLNFPTLQVDRYLAFLDTRNIRTRADLHKLFVHQRMIPFQADGFNGTGYGYKGVVIIVDKIQGPIKPFSHKELICIETSVANGLDVLDNLVTHQGTEKSSQAWIAERYRIPSPISFRKIPCVFQEKDNSMLVYMLAADPEAHFIKVMRKPDNEVDSTFASWTQLYFAFHRDREKRESEDLELRQFELIKKEESKESPEVIPKD